MGLGNHVEHFPAISIKEIKEDMIDKSISLNQAICKKIRLMEIIYGEGLKINDEIYSSYIHLKFGKRMCFICPQCSRKCYFLYYKCYELSCRCCQNLTYISSSNHKNPDYENFIRQKERLKE